MEPMTEIISCMSAVKQRRRAALAKVAEPEKMTNYEILQALALRGELDAFVQFTGLDFELEPVRFDATVRREGVAWLKRGGAL